MDYRNPYSLDRTQQRKLLLHVCILRDVVFSGPLSRSYVWHRRFARVMASHEGKCFNCENPLKDTEVNEVKKKVMETFRKSSVKRKDNKCKLLEELTLILVYEHLEGSRKSDNSGQIHQNTNIFIQCALPAGKNRRRMSYQKRNLEWERNGLNLNSKNINHLRFTDDIVVAPENPDNLEHILQELSDNSAKYHRNPSEGGPRDIDIGGPHYSRVANC
ncbi:hypothetical protein EVAR_66402_1 [Eumeta japonica]|uniref:Reverse transcriptase domain-containing protein n=1 Tax=Eumeta variegata TaxID=151549 RepID=A0A4C2A5C4_EUMVA|nr:hypothetical protein EVAR_66402_1 [Eumeta japonica]